MGESYNRVLIIGSLPPPIGGISMHVKRLIKKLQDEEIVFELFDYKKTHILAVVKKIFYASIIHINCSNKSLRFFILIISSFFRKKTIITWHGKYSFKNLFDNFSLRLCTVSLVLNEYSYENGSKILGDKKKIQLISAFIPPDEEESYLPPEIRIKLDSFTERFNCIVCTNASNYTLDDEGYDLYGIDFLLEMIGDLKDVGLIISDPSGGLVKKYASCKDLNPFLFISEPHSFQGIIKYSTVVIRATSTDGDALSIKEALFLNKNVIASDCVERPSNCQIFKLRDKTSFLEAFYTATANKSKNKSPLINGGNQIVAIYKELDKSLKKEGLSKK